MQDGDAARVPDLPEGGDDDCAGVALPDHLEDVCQPVPRNQCNTVQDKVDRQVPREEYKTVPRQECAQVPRQVTNYKTEEQCNTVTDKQCKQVPRKICH